MMQTVNDLNALSSLLVIIGILVFIIISTILERFCNWWIGKTSTNCTNNCLQGRSCTCTKGIKC